MKTIKEFEKATGIKFTINHTGKMEGIWSLSTSCICNPFCKARMKDTDCICSKCYSAAMHKRYSNLAKVLEKNFEILTSKLFEIDEFPYINNTLFRIESFGDIYNVTQARNYLRLIKANPQTFFAFFTKNWNILKQAIIFEGKPENMNVILSNPIVDDFTNHASFLDFGFCDIQFNVYSKRCAQYVDINCGLRKCVECQFCYRKHRFTENHVVNEILK